MISTHLKADTELPNDPGTPSTETNTQVDENESVKVITSKLRSFLYTVEREPSPNIELSDTLKNWMNRIITHMDKFLLNEETIHESDNENDEYDPYSVLSIINSWANNTALVPYLLYFNLPKQVVQWLGKANKLSRYDRRRLLMIVHNIARHDDGADQLNKYEAIKAIKEFHNNFENEMVEATALLEALALALLSTPEQLKLETANINDVLDQLLQFTIYAASSSIFLSSVSGISFHISESLAVLVKLFVVDESTLDYVLCEAKVEPPSTMHATIQLFANLLVEFQKKLANANSLETFTCIALFNIIWSISFPEKYRQELKNNDRLINALKDAANNTANDTLNQYQPRSMESVQSASRSILHNLGAELSNLSRVRRTLAEENPPSLTITKKRAKQESIRRAIPLPSIKNSTKQKIMISYSHQNNSFCDKILDLLATKNDIIDVWIDRIHCKTGDLWESIADGMECASVILCLISDYYSESKSCRQELTYALDTLSKPVIPIYLGEYQPRGWIGIRLTGKTYVRVHNLEQPEEKKLKTLMNMILDILDINDKTVTIPVVHYQPVTDDTSTKLTAPSPLKQDNIITSTANENKPNKPNLLSSLTKPVQDWTQMDICTWFAENYITEQLRDIYQFRTGDEMLDYAQDLVHNREKHREAYESIYSKKYNGEKLPPHEFIRFTKALELLLNKSSKTGPSSILQNPAAPASSGCVIL